MRRWLLLLSLVLATPAHAGVLWFNGLETGGGPTGQAEAGFTQEDTANNHPVALTPVNTGTFSVQLKGASVNSGFVIGPKSLNLTTLYVRLYLNIQAGVRTVANDVVTTYNTAQSHRQNSLLLNTDGTLKFCYDNSVVTCTAIATSSTALSTGIWYLIEVKSVIAGSSAGGMELKINGTTEFTSFGTTTNTNGNIDQVVFGPDISVAGADTVVYYLDDMLIRDDQYAGAGRSIARQGAAGSPTYTAWTKNSCTSSLIENCWSQTPFDAVPNATSATASAAQTMLVHDFGTTQSGHGTETINATATINACNVMAYAKSSAPHTSSVRRRLSGVDTDTAVSLITTDLFRESGFFSTTATVVRGATMEIGFVHGTGTDTDQVEDMWMLCDFIAGAASVPPTSINFD